MKGSLKAQFSKYFCNEWFIKLKAQCSKYSCSKRFIKSAVFKIVLYLHYRRCVQKVFIVLPVIPQNQLFQWNKEFDKRQEWLVLWRISFLEMILYTLLWTVIIILFTLLWVVIIILYALLWNVIIIFTLLWTVVIILYTLLWTVVIIFTLLLWTVIIILFV